MTSCTTGEAPITSCHGLSVWDALACRNTESINGYPPRATPTTQFSLALTLRSRAHPASSVPVAISSPTDVTEIWFEPIPSETK